MALTDKTTTVLKRFARGVAAAGLSYAIAKFPALFGAFHISGQEQLLLVGILTPALTAADKWLRYGSDVGEGDSNSSVN